jgi:hypothetical protein
MSLTGIMERSNLPVLMPNLQCTLPDGWTYVFSCITCNPPESAHPRHSQHRQEENKQFELALARHFGDPMRYVKLECHALCAAPTPCLVVSRFMRIAQDLQSRSPAEVEAKFRSLQVTQTQYVAFSSSDMTYALHPGRHHEDGAGRVSAAGVRRSSRVG